MLRLAADENFNNRIVRGLLHRKPDLDIVRIQDIGLSGADDQAVLEWAAQEERVLLTHDVRTITQYAYERVDADQLMPGVFEVPLLCQSAAPSKIFCCWWNIVLTANGKDRYVTCLCSYTFSY